MTVADIDSTRRIAQALDAATASLERVERVERERREPIAVVGLSCRFPQAGSPEEFWRLLEAGADAVTEIPADRWDLDEYYDPDPASPGKMYCRHGGFLDDVRGFDAPFFRASPREAESMDPQQRILLEVAWEALERAGVNPRSLQGSSTSVHIGVTTRDYTELLLSSAHESPLDTYYTTGNAPNALAGRLSYFLGLQGPSMAVDTACSSSLVAVHLACQGLRTRESNLAIAGGVNLILSPQLQAAICRANMLSAVGRCRTFADSDGYVRGEGCGILVLKRLADARRDHDPVLALIRGSAVNQDGASAGFTVPHGPSQQALIRRALEAAKVDPQDVSYLEAHGTGTPLGDPIEVNAALAVYGVGRSPERPLRMGSVKTNIGHLEAAAGVAGLIKVVLALQARTIPAHLHFSRPNPNIPWADLPVEILTRTTPWGGDEEPRIAAVSSFGASGTNAHCIVEEPPHPTPPEDIDAVEADRVLVLSADTPQALRELARAYDGFLRDHPALPLSDLCYTAAICRAHLNCRCAVTGSSIASLRQKLATVIEGETGTGIFSGQVRGASPIDGEKGGADFNHADIGRRFVEGLSVPWQDLYPRRRPAALPTYPFQHRPYWAPLQQRNLPSGDEGNILFRCLWDRVETPRMRTISNDKPCHWILFADQGGSPVGMAQMLEERGQSFELIDRTFARETVRQILRQAPDHLPLRILYFSGLGGMLVEPADTETLMRDTLHACLGLVHLVQDMSEISASQDTRVWVVTRGAHQIDWPEGSSSNPSGAQLASSGLWGLGRTIATEHPDSFGGLIDLAPEVDDDEAEELLVMVRTGKNQLILRGGEILVPKIQPFVRDSARQYQTPDVITDATYLVTGGLGALGLLVARWLVDSGARHIVLVSRRGETSESETELKLLRARGAQIWAPRADAANLGELGSVIRNIPEWPPLLGVFHLAGVLDDRVVARLDGESIEGALKPKVAGAWNLHLLTRDLALDHFVVFSSLASLVGPAGQGNYAAGNAFLDALAHHRCAAGLPALSLNWGPWSGNGMAESLGADHLDRLKRAGVRPLPPHDAFGAMEQIMRSGQPQAVVARVNWEEMFSEERPSFLREWASHLAVITSRRGAAYGTQNHESLVRERILAGDSGSLATRLTQFVTDLIAEIFHVDLPQSLDVNRPLDEYGMDSLTATELKNRVASRLAVDLPVSRVIGGVTISGLVQMIQERLANGDVSGEIPPAGEDGSETMEMVI